MSASYDSDRDALVVDRRGAQGPSPSDPGPLHAQCRFFEAFLRVAFFAARFFAAFLPADLRVAFFAARFFAAFLPADLRVALLRSSLCFRLPRGGSRKDSRVA